MCRRRMSTNSSSRHLIDSVFNFVVNLPTVPTASASRRLRKRLLRACILFIYLIYYYLCIIIFINYIIITYPYHNYLRAYLNISIKSLLCILINYLLQYNLFNIISYVHVPILKYIFVYSMYLLQCVCVPMNGVVPEV